MSGVQTASNQDMLPHHGGKNDEKRDEDPEHRVKTDAAGSTKHELDLLQGVCPQENLSPCPATGQVSGEAEVVHLDNEEFTKALEDVEFRRDLRKASQRAFRKCRQSTHGSWEDLQQEVLMRFGKWLPKWRGEANRRTIFERIAINVLIDARRRESAQRRDHEEIDLDELQHDIVGNNPWKGIETRIFLDECRNSLSDTECRMLDEYFVDGCSLRQMATSHGVSASAISKRLSRIVTKLYEHQKLQGMSIAAAA